MKIIVVGGKWNMTGGEPDPDILRIEKCIRTYEETDEVTVYNGGNTSDMQGVLDELSEYDCIFWFSEEYQDVVKQYSPHSIFVTQIHYDFDTTAYSLEKTIQHMLKTKSNICVEKVTMGGELLIYRVMDPLGCVWFYRRKLTFAVFTMRVRVDMLKSLTRKPSIKTDQEVKVDLTEKDTEFLDIVHESADVFHEIMCDPSGQMKFTNSTRCMSGFPAIRKENCILFSPRQLEQKYIEGKDLIACALGLAGETVVFKGEGKPSIDAPVELRLFEELKNIDYIFHGHCYTDSPYMTNKVYPCGSVEEAYEILKCISDNYKSRDEGFYVINLLGHGFTILTSASNLDKMKNVKYISRPIPEIICFKD